MMTHILPQPEFSRWTALLEYCHFENTRLKNRLAAAMEKSVSGNTLRLAEHFQHEFLRKDEIIRFLRQDLRAQQELATRLTGEEAEQARFVQMLQMLSDGIRFLDKDFKRLREEFDLFLSEEKYS
jgi:hypothetical protein